MAERMSDPWRKSGVVEAEAERAEYGGYTLSELHEVADNVELWARAHGKVLDLVSREPVAFDPRPLQRRIWLHYQHCKAREIPCRMVIVKVRRGGGSTGMEACLYVHAHNYNARLGTIGTDEQVAMNMYEFVKTFDEYDDFPGWQKAAKKLDGLGEVTWPNGSTWEKYTAQNPEAARSAGLQGYHASEVGRWSDGGSTDANQTLRSMLGAVPKRGFTVVGEESTAQGAAGAFHGRWQSARWPTAAELGCEVGSEYWRKWEDETPQNLVPIGSELQFVRIFAAWFEDDENSAPCPIESQQYIERTLDEKERALLRRYETRGPQGRRLGDYVVTATIYEQLAWRRSVIESEFEGDVEGFEQEYPSSPKEAFASSGRHTFNRAGCAWMVNYAKSQHPEFGVLSEQNDGSVVFTRTEEGEAAIMVWEVPKVGMRYINGTDTMSGAEQVEGSNKHDFHASVVLRASYVGDDGYKRPVKVVAQIMPKSVLEPDVLVRQVWLLSRWYGGCLIVPEVNNTGYAFIALAKNLGLNLYRRERPERFTSETTELVGWMTDAKTRPQLIAVMQAAIRNNTRAETRDDGLDCPSYTIASECATMVKDSKGKDVAASGCWDDHVLATALALTNIAGATYYAGARRKRHGPPDRGAHGWKRFGQ